MTPEAKLKAEVVEFLTLTGEWFIRMNSGIAKVRGGYMHLAPEGTADLLIMRRVPHWIELKDPKGHTLAKRAAKQFEFRQRVLALGHRHCEAKSLEDVQRFLCEVPS